MRYGKPSYVLKFVLTNLDMLCWDLKHTTLVLNEELSSL